MHSGSAHCLALTARFLDFQFQRPDESHPGGFRHALAAQDQFVGHALHLVDDLGADHELEGFTAVPGFFRGEPAIGTLPTLGTQVIVRVTVPAQGKLEGFQRFRQPLNDDDGMA
jgi:hypothetical protein